MSILLSDSGQVGVGNNNGGAGGARSLLSPPLLDNAESEALNPAENDLGEGTKQRFFILISETLAVPLRGILSLPLLKVFLIKVVYDLRRGQARKGIVLWC